MISQNVRGSPGSFAVSSDGQTLWASTFGGPLCRIDLRTLRRRFDHRTTARLLAIDRSRNSTPSSALIFQQGGNVYRFEPKAVHLFDCAKNLYFLECSDSGVISFVEDHIGVPRYCTSQYCWNVFDPTTKLVEHRRIFINRSR